MQTILDLAEANAHLLRAMLADIPPADLCRQPNGIRNHAAWQVGHVAFVRSAVAKMLGADAGLPETWAALFAPGTDPTADAATYPTKDELTAAFDRAHRASCDAVAKATPGALDQPPPVERLRGRFPTMRHLAFGMLTIHDAMHIGQLSVWRRAMGLPRTI